MEKQLPKNWIECSLGDIISSKRGRKPENTINYKNEGYLPYILIDEMEGKPVRAYTNDPKVSIVNEDEVLLVWDGSIGKCGSGIYGAIGSTLVALKPQANIPTKFIEYILNDKNRFIKQTSTGTGLQHINKDFFQICKIGLPPLAEQNRIVAKLDTLFVQLEAIKTSMTTIPILLKNFKQQVLTQAVTGKLLNINQYTELGNLKIDIKTGPFGSALHKSDYIENGIPVINPSHIHNGLIIPDNKVTISEEIFNKLKAYKLLNNDVILGRRGEMGRAALYNEDYGDCLCGTGSIILRCGDNLFPQFLTYYLRSPFCVDYLNANSVGSTMINLNQKIIKSLRVPNVSYFEQQEIVSRVESLFAKADAIEKQYESLKAKIDNLPQALLHKAFKGELTEQLDSDGDAQELLAEIQKLKAGVSKVVKSKSYKISKEKLHLVAEPK